MMEKNIDAIKAKLQKLFALMEENRGASEQEVETALKVAKKLMAEYHLTKGDVVEESAEVLRVCIDEVVFTTQSNPWVNTLLHAVANNYRCHPVVYKEQGKKKMKAGLVGFDTDIEIAKFVLKYAYDCILTGYKAAEKASEKKAMREAYYNGCEYKAMTSADRTAACNAYGNGYVRGIEEAFAEQNRTESTSFAMVMVTPQEVEDNVKGLKKKNINISHAYNNARRFDDYATKGYMCGVEFNPNQRLAG